MIPSLPTGTPSNSSSSRTRSSRSKRHGPNLGRSATFKLRHYRLLLDNNLNRVNGVIGGAAHHSMSLARVDAVLARAAHS
jgi:hypothetical protein